MKNMCYFVSNNGDLFNIEKGSLVSTDKYNSILNYIYDLYNNKSEANPIFTTSTKKNKISYQIIESYNGQFKKLEQECCIYYIYNDEGLIDRNTLTKDTIPVRRKKIDNLLNYLLSNKHISLLNNNSYKYKNNTMNIKFYNQPYKQKLQDALLDVTEVLYDKMNEFEDAYKEAKKNYQKQKTKRKERWDI